MGVGGILVLTLRFRLEYCGWRWITFTYFEVLARVLWMWVELLVLISRFRLECCGCGWITCTYIKVLVGVMWAWVWVWVWLAYLSLHRGSSWSVVGVCGLLVLTLRLEYCGCGWVTWTYLEVGVLWVWVGVRMQRDYLYLPWGWSAVGAGGWSSGGGGTLHQHVWHPKSSIWKPLGQYSLQAVKIQFLTNKNRYNALFQKKF